MKEWLRRTNDERKSSQERNTRADIDGGEPSNQPSIASGEMYDIENIIQSKINFEHNARGQISYTKGGLQVQWVYHTVPI